MERNVESSKNHKNDKMCSEVFMRKVIQPKKPSENKSKTGLDKSKGR